MKSTYVKLLLAAVQLLTIAPLAIGSVHDAADRGHLEAVQRFIEEENVDVDGKNHLGRTALHAAALSGQAEVVEYLVGVGADVNALDNDGMTPLHWAVRFSSEPAGRLLTVKTLIERGAEVNIRESNGSLPLHSALDNDTELLEILEILIPLTKELTMLDNMGDSPLHIASSRGHVTAASLLIMAGVPVDLESSLSKMTPLFDACINNRVEIVSLLLKHDAQVNCEDSQGRTSLCLAEHNQSSDVIRLLTEKTNATRS